MKRLRLRLRAETLRQLGDLRVVVGGRAYLSFPTDEMGDCSPCATIYCGESARPC